MNTRNNIILGIAEIIIWFGMIILSYFMKTWPLVWLQWLAGIIILVTAFIQFKTTFAANDNWKSWASMIAIIIIILIYAIPISVNSIK